ncbi:MAG: tyrosine recombinase XerC [Gammaproteobacteria bacterium]|nr:tyrosine recombinase XerC [Gammaproteobacteria bacterium]
MFDTELQDFFQYLRSEKRYSEHTLTNYQRDIRGFIRFCQTIEVTGWDAIDSQHVRNYAAQTHRKGLSGKSIQRMLSSLRSLFKYLLRYQKIKTNPAVGVSAPKSLRKLPEVLRADDLNHLLTLNENDPLAVRDMAIMELLYGCGLRLSELIDLNINQIDWQGLTLNVTGKGRKQRIVPFGEKAVRALRKWFGKRSLFVGENQQAVFVSQRGTRISPASVQQRLKKWAKEKGLDRRVYPHLMRHSFASHILESSQDLRAVQELLGHANLTTTQIYTHVDFQQLAKVYDAAHPRAKKKS